MNSLIQFPLYADQFYDSFLSRESKLDGVNIEEYSPPVQASPNSEVVQTWRSRSLAEGERGRMELQRSAISHRRFTSENNGMHFSSPGRGSPCSSLNQEGNSDRDNQTRRTPSVGSRFSTCSSSEIIDDSILSHLSSTHIHGEYRSASVTSSAIVSISPKFNRTVLYKQHWQLYMPNKLNTVYIALP